jgi:hypothetical protein
VREPTETAPLAGPGEESLNASRVPPLNQIVDSGTNIWTMGGPDGNGIYRNGADTNGLGSEILYWNKVTYVWGTNNFWWKYDDATAQYSDVGAADPSDGTKPQRDTAPTVYRSPFSEKRGAVAIVY